MPNISDQLADLAILRSLLLTRVANGLSSQVAQAYQNIIDELATDIRSATPINLRNMNATIAELKSRFEVDVSFLNDELSDLAMTESAFALNSVNSAVGVNVFNKVPAESTIRNIIATSLLSDGKRAETIEAWFNGINSNMVRDIEGVVKQGVISGKTNQELASQLSGVLGTSRKHAETLTRTATSMVSNEAREAVYSENEDVIYAEQFHATLDGSTSFGCSTRDGSLYERNTHKPLNEKAKLYTWEPCPRHFNCRSLYLIILKSWEELGLPFDEIPVGTRSSLDGGVPADINFDKWFESKDKAFQERYLGVSRYKLYKDGKITFKDLVNQNGQTLSVAELSALNKTSTVAKVVAPKVPTIDFGYDGKFNGYVADIRNEAKIVINKLPKPKEIKLTKKRGSYNTNSMVLTSINSQKTFVHEYGHHIDDYAMPVLERAGGRIKIKQTLSARKSFIEAYEADKVKYSTIDINKVDKLIDDSGYDSKTMQAFGISDIMDSFKNGHIMQFKGKVGHGIAGYESDVVKRSETFANLFEIYSRQKEWNRAKELFPNLTTEFEKIIGEI